MRNVSSTPEERSVLGRVRAIRQHASMTPEQASAHTKNARAAFEQGFLDQAGGDPERAAKLRQAWFLELSLKSAQARRRAKEQTAIAVAAESELDAIGGQ